MSILYKNATNVRFVLFMKNSTVQLWQHHQLLCSPLKINRSRNQKKKSHSVNEPLGLSVQYKKIEFQT